MEKLTILFTLLQQSPADAFNAVGGEVTGTVETITNWILVTFGVVSLFQLIMIFISGGSGEDKIKKAGTWIFLLVFTVIGYFISRQVFN